MRRRSFLFGSVGAVSGATLLASGNAFSRTETQRDVKVEIVGDEDAYLRLIYGEQEVDCEGTVDLVEISNHTKGALTDIQVDIDVSNDLTVEVGDVPDSLAVGESGVVTIDVDCTEVGSTTATVTFTITAEGPDQSITVQDRQIEVACVCPLGPSISWIAFSGGTITANDVEMVSFTTDADGDPIQLTWNATVPVETVVVFGDGEMYNVPGTQQTVQVGDGTEVDWGPTPEDSEQHPRSPCPDGECGVKFEWDSTVEAFVIDDHQDEC